jgi:hypothetical protein
MEKDSILIRLQGPVAAVSALGFALSAGLHLALYRWPSLSVMQVFIPLFFGIFLVWFPTVLSMQRFNAVKKKGLFGFRVWKYATAGAPPILVWLAGAALVYAMVNFFIAMPVDRSVGPALEDSGFFLVGTGHAMAFYAAALVFNVAAIQRRATGTDWECERGHMLVPSDSFCSECGSPARKQRATP